jgi:hypothetical protein
MYGDGISQHVDHALATTPLSATVDAMVSELYAMYTRTDEIVPTSFAIPQVKSQKI